MNHLNRAATWSMCTVGFFLFAAQSSAQSQIEWLRTHDGPSGQNDYGTSCDVDPLGNVYVAGLAYGTSVSDIALVKYSPAGAELWSVHTDVFGDADGAADCRISPAGDLYVCGRAGRAGGNGSEAVLLQYSSSGALQWTRTFSPAGFDSEFSLITFDAAGNVLVGGIAHSAATDDDVIIASYTPVGVRRWSAQFDGTAHGHDYLSNIRVLQSGEIAVAGALRNLVTGLDFIVWKLSATGAVVWASEFDGGAYGSDIADDIVEGPGGKLIVCGSGTPGGAVHEDWLVAELNVADGALGWMQFYDGRLHDDDHAHSIGIDASGVVWVSGTELNVGTRFDAVVRRFTSAGSVLSTVSWNNTGAYTDEYPHQLLFGAAGQVWAAGFTEVFFTGNADAFIVQYDSSGALNWAHTHSSVGLVWDRPIDMALAPGNRIVMAGTAQIGTTSDMLALQVDLSESPQAYCTAKTTSNGCEPRVSFTGMPSMSASSGFVARAEQLRNNKSGLLFYGVSGAIANPFLGGTLCIAPPRVRTALQSSGGNAAPTEDCSGSFALDMNAYAAGALGGAPLPALQAAGTAVYCQFWGRDPAFAPPLSAMLTNALRYVVLP